MSWSNLYKLLKITLLALSFGVVFHKIGEFYEQSEKIFMGAGPLEVIQVFFLLFILMLINWSLEALKWKILVNSIQPFRFKKSLISVFIGITFGLLTPKRLGEIGGRILMLDKRNQGRGVLGFILGSLVQSSVTVIIGILAILTTLSLLNNNLFKDFRVLLILSVSSLVLILFFLISFERILKALSRIRFLNIKQSMIQAAGEYDFGLISKVFLLGFIRYLVFSCQFFLLVRLFGNPIPVHQLITGIGLTYLVITFLPFSSILELGIRGSVAAFVFSLFTFQTGNIVLATLAIWIVNLGIPALIGAMLLYQSNTLTFAQLSLKKHLKPAIKKLN